MRFFSLTVFRLAFFPLAVFPQSLIFEHATVIDATGAPAKTDVSVLIRDGRIAAVGKVLRAEDSVAIDARGKFIIPGLWDMHFHVSRPDVQFPLLVANGVTGVREMYTGAPQAQAEQWRALTDAPTLVLPGFIDGPRLLSAGPLPPNAAVVGSAFEARSVVRRFALAGVDFLKIYSSLPRAAFLGVAQEAKTLRLPFAGHVPEEVSPIEASNAGMRSQEHLNNILLAASTREDRLRKERVIVMNDPGLSGKARLRMLAWPDVKILSDTYSPAKAALLFRTFVKNGTWQTPTLVALLSFSSNGVSDDALRRYHPQAWTSAWDPRQSNYFKDLSEAEIGIWKTRARAILVRHRIVVRDMQRAGVGILAGTDTHPNTPLFPGWSLHEELALLVESGLTPMQAVQSATRNPALYFDRLNDMGTVEVGKMADLVILDANPLLDIRNTQKISGVVMRGKYYSRRDLDALLAAAESAALKQ